MSLARKQSNKTTSTRSSHLRPEKWLMVAYEVPNEPSKFRVKVWRDLKSQGALYPPMSFCVLPYSPNIMPKLREIRSEVADIGSFLVLQAKGFEQPDEKLLKSLMIKQTESQYRELLEECQEFLDEIKSNINQKVFKDEEIQELDESLDGLKRWFGKIQSLDKQDDSPRVRSMVKQLLDRCHKELDSYAAKVEKRKKNRPIGLH